jgi:hypothetical protein
MKEQHVRSVLRLIAVVTVLVGAYLTTATLVSFLAASNTMNGALEGLQVKLTGLVAEMGVYAVLSNALIAAWGLVLYYSSPKLAEMIVE